WLHSSLFCFFYCPACPRPLPSFPTRRSSDLADGGRDRFRDQARAARPRRQDRLPDRALFHRGRAMGHADDDLGLGEGRALVHLRSEEHTSELQSRENLVCRLLLEKKKTNA